MKYEEISFDEIISEALIENGGMILLTGWPAVGKTEACFNLIDKYKKGGGYLYFDLDGDIDYSKQINDKFIITEYLSSISIVNKIEEFVKNEKIKFVFIDSWGSIENKDNWFIQRLYTMSYKYKIVFIIVSTLSRKVEKRKSKLPKLKELNNINGIITAFINYTIMIFNPSIYNVFNMNLINKDIQYLRYKKY